MAVWEYLANPFWAASKDAVKAATGSDVRDYIPGIGDQRAQEEANRINVEQAKLNREFQERLSNTAYQRATADMKKSGINPMLAYMQGGAHVPSGSQATVASAPKTGLANFALESATNLGSYQNKVTALQQQSDVNASSIRLNESAAAKNLMDAEATRIHNVKNRKWEPLNEAAARATKKGSEMIDRVLDSFGNTAKSVKERMEKFDPFDRKKTDDYLKRFRNKRSNPYSPEWLKNMYDQYDPTKLKAWPKKPKGKK